jgi:hypothetical protein
MKHQGVGGWKGNKELFIFDYPMLQLSTKTELQVLLSEIFHQLMI